MNQEINRRGFLKKAGETAAIVAFCGGRLAALEGLRRGGPSVVEFAKEKITGDLPFISENQYQHMKEIYAQTDHDALLKTREQLAAEQTIQEVQDYKDRRQSKMIQGGALIFGGSLLDPRLIQSVAQGKHPADFMLDSLQSESKSGLGPIQSVRIGVKLWVEQVKDFVNPKSSL